MMSLERRFAAYFLVQVRPHEVALFLGIALAGVWLAAEAIGRVSTWHRGAPRHPGHALDRGTYPYIATALIVSLTVTVLAFFFGLGGYLPPWTSYLGFGVAGLGVAVRLWAMRTLGRFFTMPITTSDDHELVREGPYRWLRHPAYTGNFLVAIGVPLVLGSPVGLAVTLVCCLAAYIHRIRIEEAVLVDRFGTAYQQYSRNRARLIPPIY